MEAENAKLRAEINQLRSEKPAPVVHVVTAKKKPTKADGEETKLWVARIHRVVRKVVWPRCKFLGPKKLPKAADLVFDYLKLKDFAHMDKESDEYAKAKAVWVAENQDHIRQGLNECRNYFQSQVREEMVKRINSIMKNVTATDIYECATRDPKLLESEEGKELLEWYTDILLPKVAGSESWGRGYRHHHRISEAINKDTKHKCIAPGTEAFLVLLFEGCEEKWRYLAECKLQKTKPDRKDPRCTCKYTNPEQGQSPWGGWNKEGKTRFKNLQAKIKEARQGDGVKEYEDTILVALRKKHGLDASATKTRRTEEEEADESDGENDFGY